MKKITLFLTLGCLVLSLCGCADMGKTTEYRKAKKVYNSFVDKKEYTKQDIFDKLGQPQYPDIGYEQATAGMSIDEMLFDSNTREWMYFFHEFSDPANPHKLVVSFDSDANVTDMLFEAVVGG